MMKKQLFVAALAMASISSFAWAGGYGSSSSSNSTGSNSASASGSVMFQNLDANHDGKISRDEAKNAPEISNNFSTADVNKDGKLDASEFSALETPKDSTSSTPGSGTTTDLPSSVPGGSSAPSANPGGMSGSAPNSNVK